MLVDLKVDVGRFFVAEGRAGLGQVKHVAFPFSKSEIASMKIVCEKSCVNNVYILAEFATSASTFAHVDFLLVTLPMGEALACSTVFCPSEPPLFQPAACLQTIAHALFGWWARGIWNTFVRRWRCGHQAKYVVL
jgi:hypothetical protein